MAHILLVDSDELHTELLSSFIQLRRAGDKIWAANDAVEALNVLRHIKIDLVITDLYLEGDMDGIELLQKLSEEQPVVPAIALSAMPENFGAVAHTLGATMLAKPPPEEQLLVEMNRLLRLHSLKPLHGTSVTSIMQMVAGDMSECELTVLSASAKGRLYLAGGNVVHAEAEGLQGEDAVVSMAQWRLHHFHTTPAKASVRTVHQSLTGLLMEVAFRIDQAQSTEP